MAEALANGVVAGKSTADVIRADADGPIPKPHIKEVLRVPKDNRAPTDADELGPVGGDAATLGHATHKGKFHFAMESELHAPGGLEAKLALTFIIAIKTGCGAPRNTLHPKITETFLGACETGDPRPSNRIGPAEVSTFDGAAKTGTKSPEGRLNTVNAAPFKNSEITENWTPKDRRKSKSAIPLVKPKLTFDERPHNRALSIVALTFDLSTLTGRLVP